MKKLTTLIFVLCLFASFNTDDALEGPPTLVGFLYTSTNGENTNQLIKIDRFSDGSLLNEITYSTNSPGGANTGAGGDAKGDFDAQNAIQIIGDYLLNVNAGGNTISVFSIDRPTGSLTFKNPNDPRETISEVMYSVGFNSKSSFNTLFKEKTGLTPSEYKKKNLQRSSENKK